MGARLGQHFLRDQAVVDDILAAARLAPGQSVLEVGSGPATLTRPLSAAVAPAGKIVAIEADRNLAEALRAQHLPGVEVVHADAVQHDLSSHGRFDRIVSNLPYLISGPITIAFLDLLRNAATRWDRAVLMYQREFAERLLAVPGNGDYGRLTVHASRWVKALHLRDVAPGAFEPPPKVWSAVVVLEPHEAPPFHVADERLWRAAVDGPFQQRRKKLRNTLPPAVSSLGVPAEVALAALEQEGATDRRPEEIAPEAFARMVAAMAASREA